MGFPPLPGRIEKHAIQPIHRKVQEFEAEPDARKGNENPVNKEAHSYRKPQCLRQKYRQ